MSSDLAPKEAHQESDAVELSVVMACYNAQGFLEEAVGSALSQVDVTLEVLITDDHSTDGSLDLAQKLSEADPRVRVFQTPHNLGPGGARNIGIEAMRGEWYGVLDCDDRMAPERSRLLIDEAKALGADMIADDLHVFGGTEGEHRHLGDAFASLRDISLDAYFNATQMYGPNPNLGFLKPLIRRSALHDGGHRYHEDLRIAEDDELVIKLLLAGRRYVLSNKALYHYRKHDASISHRLSADHAARMVASEEMVRAAVVEAGHNSAAYQARYNSIQDAASFSRTVQAIKQRDWIASLREIAQRPRALRHFVMPIKSRLQKLSSRLGVT